MINLKQSVLASTLAISSFGLGAVESYTVIDLGKIEDKPFFVYDINDADEIVGYSYSANNIPFHGVAVKDGMATDLPAIVNETTDLSAYFKLNNNGVSVGFSSETIIRSDQSVNIDRAIYTDIINPELKLVPPLDEETPLNMRALSINDGAFIVGVADYNAPDDEYISGGDATKSAKRGFVYDSVNDILTRLEPLNYNQYYVSAALVDINNNGLAIGWSEQYKDSFNTLRGYYVNVNTPTELIEIPASAEDRSNRAMAINQQGIIAGMRNVDRSFYFTGYLFDTNTETLTDIPNLKEDYFPQSVAAITTPYDINSENQVVGISLIEIAPVQYHAFIYENGETKDLNTLIDCKADPDAEQIGQPDWVLQEARAINNNGVIVGNGFLNGQKRAFKLVPRHGVAPKPCQDLVIKEDSGSGSFSWGGLLVLMTLAGLRRRQSKV
ncbi:DUF3466 family protein [Aliikangiella maris]|uniref:DUF3466 family protein n=2 Tax=Aliikangiella maris TaxID=3162458 RepID=A0ABV3MKG9_9GAMM